MTDFSEFLFVSDFDRTITDNDGAIPPCNLTALQDFIAGGGIFTVASGRSIPMFRPKAALLSCNAPCILNNGAVLYDYRSESLLSAMPLPDAAETLVSDVMARFPGVHVELQCADGHYCFGHDPLRDAYLHKNGTHCFYVPLPEVPKPRFKLSVYGRFRGLSHEVPASVSEADRAAFHKIQAYISEVYGSVFAITRSMPRIVELQHPASSKGAAARLLAQSLHRRLLCAGDAPNDVSMLQEAERAFLPADCDPEARRAGFEIVCACGEGAIRDILLRLRQQLHDPG